MPDATVNIGGDAAGGLAAVAAMQGAIDGLHGKTVVLNVEHRGGAAVAGMASDMGRAGDAADRAGRSARGMGEHFDRAGRSAHSMGDNLGRAGDHVGRMADEAGRLSGHLDAVNRIMGGGAPSSIGRASGMAALAGDANRARGAIGGIGGESSRSLGVAGAGAIGAGRGMRELAGGAESAGRFMAGASGAAQRVSRDLVPMAAGADGVYRSVSRMASAGSEVERFAGSMRTIDAAGRTVESGLGGLSDIALPSARAITNVGLVAGVSAIGMGALGAAVAGVGLAGVAEDFAHNSQLMHAGGQAVRGFNREFSAMKGETSAAAGPAMAGVASSMKGVGHELAQIGAANIGPVLNDVSSLGNQATQAMQKLAPSIGPSLQAATALGGAILGAFGDSGPAVTSFANQVTSAAPGLQKLTSNLIDGASAVGGVAVGAAGGLGDLLAGDVGRSNSGSMDLGVGGFHPFAWMANRSFSPLSARPAGTGMWGNRTGGGGGGPATPGGFDPSQPFSGTLPDGTVGPGEATPVKAARPAGPSPDAARFAGMTGAQIYNQQYQNATGVQPGQPMYSGLGPRGGGQSVGPMPASAAVGLGGGSIAPLNALSSAMTSQVAGGGAATGQGLVQHIQKAVQVASPAATAGGAAIGGAINAGTAQGVTSTQTVTDTVMIKHSKRILEVSAGALGIHSPSDEMDWQGRMTSQGYARGVERESHRAGTAVAGMVGQHKFGYDYEAGSAPLISIRKQSPTKAASGAAVAGQAIQYSSPLANANIDAHNARAGVLRQGIADRHEIALANLGVPGHVDPRRMDVNPFVQAGQSVAGGVGSGVRQSTHLAVDPVSQLSRDMQNRFRKDNGINSPSTVYAGYSANIPGGAAAGVAGNTGAAVAAVAGMSNAMAGPLNNQGLQIGYSFATNIVDGATRVLKTANFQASGTPQIANQQAAAALGRQGLLGAGAGASVYATPSVSFPTANSQPQVIHLNIPVILNGQEIANIAHQVSVDNNNSLVEQIRDALGGANS